MSKNITIDDTVVISTDLLIAGLSNASPAQICGQQYLFPHVTICTRNEGTDLESELIVGMVAYHTTPEDPKVHLIAAELREGYLRVLKMTPPSIAMRYEFRKHAMHHLIPIANLSLDQIGEVSEFEEEYSDEEFQILWNESYNKIG